MLIKNIQKFISIINESRGSEKYKTNANANDIIRKCGEETLKILKLPFFKNKIKKLGLEIPSSGYLCFGLLPILLSDTNTKKRTLFSFKVPMRTKTNKPTEELSVKVVYDPSTSDFGTTEENRTITIFLSPVSDDIHYSKVVERIKETVVHEVAHARDNDLYKVQRGEEVTGKDYYESSLENSKLAHMIYLMDPYEILGWMTEAWHIHKRTKKEFIDCLKDLIYKSFSSAEVASICGPFIVKYFLSYCINHKDYFNKFGSVIPMDVRKKLVSKELCEKMYKSLARLSDLITKQFTKKGSVITEYKFLKAIYYEGILFDFDYMKLNKINKDFEENGVPDYVQDMYVGDMLRDFWKN